MAAVAFAEAAGEERMRTRHLTNQDMPMPAEYAEMVRHYIPNAANALIKDAWKHNATPLEVMRHFERVEAKLREKNA